MLESSFSREDKKQIQNKYENQWVSVIYEKGMSGEPVGG